MPCLRSLRRLCCINLVTLLIAVVWVRTGTHIGKVLVQTSAEVPALAAPLASTPAVPQISFRLVLACRHCTADTPCNQIVLTARESLKLDVFPCSVVPPDGAHQSEKFQCAMLTRVDPTL